VTIARTRALAKQQKIAVNEPVLALRHNCCLLRQRIGRTARGIFLRNGDRLSQRCAAIHGVQVHLFMIESGLHFKELDGLDTSGNLSTEPPRVLLLTPRDDGQNGSRWILVRSMMSCMRDGLLITRNGRQSMVSRVQGG